VSIWPDIGLEPVTLKLASRKGGSLETVILQFWLADKLGRLWLGLHKGLRPRLGELPGDCALLARGAQFPAARLHRAERFAVSVWWRASMAAVLLVGPVIGIAAAVRPGRIGTDVAVGLIFVLGFLVTIAVAQTGLLSFRAGQTRWYLVKAGPGAAEEPLPRDSLGLPSRWDFWVMLIIAVAVFGILLYAGTRSAQH
jgi:hypothetical protein